MGEKLATETAANTLSELLLGCSINQVQYYVTGWELRVISSKGEEYFICAAEIEVPDMLEWWGSLSSPSFDLKDTNEPLDTAVAVAIFTVLNKWPIISSALDDEGNLFLHFENQCILKCVSLVEMVDWTWQIKDNEKRSIVTCDSGDLYKCV